MLRKHMFASEGVYKPYKPGIHICRLLNSWSRHLCSCMLVCCKLLQSSSVLNDNIQYGVKPCLCRNAYIVVAVHGSGYCTSAFRAAKLILNNILRVAAVNVVGDALLWLGKVCLPAVLDCLWVHL